MGYIVFTYTFHLWGGKRDVAPVATHAVRGKVNGGRKINASTESDQRRSAYVSAQE